MNYPVANGLDRLQGKKDVTLGNLLPNLEGIKRLLKIEQEKATVVRPLVDELLDSIERRFASFYFDEECILAATVHPL